ncbi:hypothetical protein CENSYa_0793 [Cenarchaeum symbiosum A]|uniref:IPT/TIG domain-containing protein n=1 Tax=Cenarchaeum symbiosum (strain A) TaxID=414004 RepID=A0RVQ9_CENSY|nr:hypothetical protein CENSYa_0793 [Cenarchaeum symbiosum A]
MARILAAAALILLAAGLHGAYGEIGVSTDGFGRSTIMQFENTGSPPVEAFRLWLPPGVQFNSFKAPDGWTGTSSPQGLLVFRADLPLESGEIAKFGLVTNIEEPGINWKALGADEAELGLGKILVSEPPPEPVPAPVVSEPVEEPEPVDEPDPGVLPGSAFRFIPEKPSVGSTVRVTGAGFGSGQELGLFMGESRLDTFSTDESGTFVITSKIPAGTAADRVDFAVRDGTGGEKTFSLRLADAPVAQPGEEEIVFTVGNIPAVVNPGDVVTVGGTGAPGGSLTATVKAPPTDEFPEGETLNTASARINLDGTWSHEAVVPIDAVFGRYHAEITDGKNTVEKTWTVESDEHIRIEPIKQRFEPGEELVFNGTAIAGSDLEAVLENPQGAEISAKTVSVDSSGFVQVNFSTSSAYPEGTYVMYAAQGDHRAIVPVGLGQLPMEQILFTMDKLNYVAGDVARLAITGAQSSTVSLVILDPSDQEYHTNPRIFLGSNGKVEHPLDLDGYKSGVFSVVLQRGDSQAKGSFSVGLQTGSGPIKVQTVKSEYAPGDPILVLGESGANILIILDLIDPSGTIVKTREAFTDKNGKINEDEFRVPADAALGEWKVIAKSGPNFGEAPFEVKADIEDGMVIAVEEIKDIAGRDHAYARIYGAQSSITILVYSAGEEIATIKPQGRADPHEALWPVPGPGTYTLAASDGKNNANTTFTYDG